HVPPAPTAGVSGIRGAGASGCAARRSALRSRAMDEIVKAALKKWPSVPHCYDWLALDARGQWFMRDERIRRAGAFPQVKGSMIRHEKLLEFIQRNYEHDEHGCWFFQNGPQRVHVELAAAPLGWRVGWPHDRLT